MGAEYWEKARSGRDALFSLFNVDFTVKPPSLRACRTFDASRRYTYKRQREMLGKLIIECGSEEWGSHGR